MSDSRSWILWLAAWSGMLPGADDGPLRPVPWRSAWRSWLILLPVYSAIGLLLGAVGGRIGAAVAALTLISVLGRFGDAGRRRYARLGVVVALAVAVPFAFVPPSEFGRWRLLALAWAVSTAAAAVFVAMTHVPARSRRLV